MTSGTDKYLTYLLNILKVELVTYLYRESWKLACKNSEIAASETIPLATSTVATFETSTFTISKNCCQNF